MSDDLAKGQAAGLAIGCIIAVSLMLISIILLILELLRPDNHVHTEQGQPTPSYTGGGTNTAASRMANPRFEEKILGVSDMRFTNSSFLKYYVPTDKCPTNDEIISSLLKLSEIRSRDHPVLQAIRCGDPDHNVLKVYVSDALLGSAEFYRYINAQLREDNENIIEKLMPFIRRATYQINHHGPSQDLTVYRGMHLDPKDQFFFTVGKTFRFQGFTSASEQITIARRFGNIIFQIKIYAGCHQVRNVASISPFPTEEEWLFSPYSRFKVLQANPGVIWLEALENIV